MPNNHTLTSHPLISAESSRIEAAEVRLSAAGLDCFRQFRRWVDSQGMVCQDLWLEDGRWKARIDALGLFAPKVCDVPAHIEVTPEIAECYGYVE